MGQIPRRIDQKASFALSCVERQNEPEIEPASRLFKTPAAIRGPHGCKGHTLIGSGLKSERFIRPAPHSVAPAQLLALWQNAVGKLIKLILSVTAQPRSMC
ncbi:hypothetical protein MPC4_240049 [Methylocella tundrae]|uniref:Uncharacterized protein n=1 Tax=Methylocella tundrae TaxID=227605 RepID=A0A8B6M6J1_METTU|nr:hypothetical protein [Methylocella tundrae]VTZ50470.1 hypothetical protein MPC4_240049 [Methylocella tundrae]